MFAVKHACQCLLVHQDVVSAVLSVSQSEPLNHLRPSTFSSRKRSLLLGPTFSTNLCQHHLHLPSRPSLPVTPQSGRSGRSRRRPLPLRRPPRPPRLPPLRAVSNLSFT